MVGTVLASSKDKAYVPCGSGAVSKWVSVLVSDKFMKLQNQNRPSPFPGGLS